jgi:hypothetical protein
MSYVAKGVPDRCLVSVAPAFPAKAPSEGWRLCLRPNNDSNTKEYRVFNKSSGLVEVSSDVVFVATIGSPREQVDLDDIDEEEVPTTAMRIMAIGDVRPQELHEQDQPSPLTMVHPQLKTMYRYLKKRGRIKGELRKNRL